MLATEGPAGEQATGGLGPLGGELGDLGAIGAGIPGMGIGQRYPTLSGESLRQVILGAGRCRWGSLSLDYLEA